MGVQGSEQLFIPTGPRSGQVYIKSGRASQRSSLATLQSQDGHMKLGIDASSLSLNGNAGLPISDCQSVVKAGRSGEQPRCFGALRARGPACPTQQEQEIAANGLGAVLSVE
jgi:hypothetical protein